MSFDIMFNQAIKLHENGQIDAAEKIYRELLETAPKNPDLLHLLGLIAHQKEAVSSAVDFIGKAVALKPDHVPFIFSLAHALQDWGKHFEALESYRRVTELEPNIPETWNNMGNIYRVESNPNKAKECFEKALAISPSFIVAINNLSLVCLDSGDVEAAKGYLQKAISIKDDYDEALFNLANIERESGNLEAAIDNYKKALKANPSFARCFNSMGVAFEQAENFIEAQKAFEDALKINPKYADALKNLANILSLTGKENEAEDKYKEAIKLDKNLFDAYVNLGNLLQRQGRLQEALEYYRKAIILNPKQPEVCNNLAIAVQASGDVEEAVGLFCNSLYLKPDLLQTKYNLALALYDMYRSHDKEKAIKIAENWLRTYKEDPIAKHTFFSLKGETAAEGVATAYLSEFFDAFAEDFERTLNNLSYQTPLIIKDILKPILKDKTELKIVDLGCGTGLCGDFLKPYAKELIGVDISSKMLEKANGKMVYTQLENKEIVDYLNKNKGFDLIIAADVFCYLGELERVLSAIKNALNKDGYALFSVEQEASNKDYQIYPSGRYKHSKEYIENLANKIGFKAISIKNQQIRLEKDESVEGLIVTIKRILL